MSDRTLSLPELRAQGLKALQERLGPVDTVRFLQLFDRGAGDYTADRQQWLNGVTLDEVFAEIDKRRATPQ